MLLRALVVSIAAAIFGAATVRQFALLPGPYFEIPATIQDNVSHERYPSRDAILLSRRAARLLPRGATVTVLMPSQAPNYDLTLYFTAVGLMPHQSVVPPSVDAEGAAAPQYVLAVREPFEHPRYRLHSTHDEGRVYVRID